MIDTKLLRQKILDLAIRGKLVPQDPNDEPASELLKKIKAEKEALIKAGKLKRDKHESFIFRGDDKRYYEQIDGKTTDISGEIPFDLPTGWVWCRIKNFADVTTGSTPKTSVKSFYGGDILFVKPPDLGSSKYIKETAETLTKQGAQKSRMIPAGSVCVCCIGSLGKSSIASDSVCTNQQINSLTTVANSEYVYYLCNTTYFINALHSVATAITIALVNKSNMEKIIIPLPPLAEQKRIVAQIESLLKCVDEIDKESETLEKSITLAKQKILDLAIRGKLVPQDPDDEPASELLKKIKAEKETLIKVGKLKRDKHESFIFRGDDNCYYEQLGGKTVEISNEIPFDLPNGWTWCRLSHIAKLSDGDWIESKDQSPYGIRLIQTGNIGRGHFISHKERARYISQETFSRLNCTEIFSGDCLISRLPDPLGRACIIPFSEERMITAVDCTITRPYKAVLSTAYFVYFTASVTYREYVEKNATGSTRKRISRAKLEKTLIPLPPLAEQQRIVEIITQYYSILESISK